MAKPRRIPGTQADSFLSRPENGFRGKEETVNGEGLFASCIQQHKENEKRQTGLLDQKNTASREKNPETAGPTYPSAVGLNHVRPTAIGFKLRTSNVALDYLFH